MQRNQVSDCQSCGSEDRWFLHNIRHRGIYRRLCTSCVLKFYSGSYCCVCFQVFDLSSLPNDAVFCLKCPSISHLHCVAAKGSYLCPPCSNPSFSFFDISTSTSSKNQKRRMDCDLAKVLVAAAEIASISMGKAATATMKEAESRAKDAAFAQKRAKESLEYLYYAMLTAEAKTCKEKDKETVGNSTKSSSAKQKKKKSKTIGDVDAAIASHHHRSHFQLNVEGNDKLGKSKDSFSTEKEKMIGGSSPIVINMDASNNMYDKDGERLQLQKCVVMNGNTPSIITNSEGHILEGDTENNGIRSDLPGAGHLHPPPKSNHSEN